MLKDRLENLSKYRSLDDSLSSFTPGKTDDLPSFSDFVVDKEHTTLFTVDEGEGRFATGWRENRDNREVLGVMTASKGEFVLYLPGEPFIVRAEDSTIRYWSVK